MQDLANSGQEFGEELFTPSGEARGLGGSFGESTPVGCERTVLCARPMVTLDVGNS